MKCTDGYSLLSAIDSIFPEGYWRSQRLKRKTARDFFYPISTSFRVYISGHLYPCDSIISPDSPSSIALGFDIAVRIPAEQVRGLEQRMQIVIGKA